MSTAAEWIKVPLTAEQMRRAEEWGYGRNQRAVRAGARMRTDHLQRNILGLRGEFAARLYLGLVIPDRDETWADEIRRTYDFAGYSVRSSSAAWKGLMLARGDVGPFIHVVGHEAPKMWLTGEISTEAAWRYAVRRTGGDNRNGTEFFTVEQRYLEPLPPRNGYEPQGERWLVSPRMPFWCEACDSNHAIIEHRDCRSALGRLTQQWATKAMKHTYQPTEETGTT